MTGKENMTCTEARDQFALMLYGELSFDEEERVESHLDTCSECRAALEHQKELHAAIDHLAVEPSPLMLESCRKQLWSALEEPRPKAASWWEQVRANWRISVMRPAGALTLLAIGFFAARMLPQLSFTGGSEMSLADLGNARVRNVETQPDGQVQIVVDQTQQRVVLGKMEDRRIHTLLVSAAKDATDPNLRVETIQMLSGQLGSPDVRDALVAALVRDQNAGVRLKALQELKPLARDPIVQDALARVLLVESNPGMRTEAIDLLSEDSDASSMDLQILGMLQELMGREENSYVRQRAQRVLTLHKASAGIY